MSILATREKLALYKATKGKPEAIILALDEIRRHARQALDATLANTELRINENFDKKLEAKFLSYEANLRKIISQTSLAIDSLETQISQTDKILAKFQDQVEQSKKRIESIKPQKGDRGEPGKEPTTGVLMALIETMMPEVKDGHTPTNEEINVLIKPYFIEYKKIIDKINVDVSKSIQSLPVKDMKALEKLVEDIASKYVKKNQGYTGGGANNFFELADVPNKQSRFGAPYQGLAGRVLRVASDGKRLEFIAPGSGALNVETPTGAVNSINDTFTVSAEPVYVVADGIQYFDGAGYTFNSPDEIVLTLPPSQYIRSIY
jgi:hypothetical protein